MTGATISVKFTNASTYTGSTYLDVNGTGQKRIRSTANGGAAVNGLWNNGEVVTFAYDGTSWILTGQDITAEELVTLESTLGLSAGVGRLYQILDKIAQKLTDTGLQQLVGNQITYRRKNGVVYVTIESLPKPTTQVVGTLPEGFRPVGNAQMVLRSNQNTVVTGWIQANGTINVNYSAIPSGVVNITGIAVFPVND